MSAPFVNRRVKVTGTSKTELNGQTGQARSYNASAMRYTVLLDSGISVALKPVNLLPDGTEDDGVGSGGMPGMAGMPGMPDMSQLIELLPSWLKEKLQRGQTPDMSDLLRLLPPGVTIPHVGLVVVLFIVLVLKFGLLKTGLLFAILSYLVYSGYGAFTRAGGGVACMKAAAEAAGQEASGKIRAVSLQVSGVNLPAKMAQGALVAVLVALLYFILFSGAEANTSAASYSPGYRDHHNSFASRVLSLEQAYRLGHADGVAGVDSEFGWSKNAPPQDDDYDYMPPPPHREQYSAPGSGGGGGLSSLFSFGKLFTVGMLGKQVHGLGSQPGGGWSKDLAVANLMNMGAVQKGFMALMVMRLFGMSPI